MTGRPGFLIFEPQTGTTYTNYMPLTGWLDMTTAVGLWMFFSPPSSSSSLSIGLTSLLHRSEWARLISLLS